MLICHKFVASNGAEVLQAFHMSDVQATSAVSIMPALWEVACHWASHPVLSITSGFSNTITRQRRLTTTSVAWGSCRTHENCIHAEQIIIIFYLFIFYFLLYVFGIVFICIIQINSYCLHWQYYFHIIIYSKYIKQFIFHWWGVLPQREVKACKKSRGKRG